MMFENHPDLHRLDDCKRCAYCQRAEQYISEFFQMVYSRCTLTGGTCLMERADTGSCGAKATRWKEHTNKKSTGPQALAA